MDPRTILSLEIDLQKLSRTCNALSCQKIPSKEMLILENDGHASKELLAISFCEEHFTHHAQPLFDKLSRACEPGTFLEKRVEETGYITY